MLSPREQFICALDNKPLKDSDIIICPTGGNMSRAFRSVDLWREKRAEIVVITGGLDKPPFSIPAPLMRAYLNGAGVPEESMFCDPVSLNTMEQATTVAAMAREYSWISAILVTSHYHQYRAYLTFLKAMQKIKYTPCLYPAIVSSEFDITALHEEFNKIKKYQVMGHCASFEEGLEHLFNA